MSPDERDERQTSYEPRQRAEQRGWGQAAVDKMHESAPAPRVAYDEIAERLDGARASGLSAPAALAQEAARAQEPTTPFDAPNPEVVYAGFLDSIQKATPQTIDAVWAEVNKCIGELPEDNYEVLRAYVRQRKVDFCRTPEEFAACARAIQKGFTGEAREKLETYYKSRKAAVLGGEPVRARDPLPATRPDDDLERPF